MMNKEILSYTAISISGIANALIYGMQPTENPLLNIIIPAAPIMLAICAGVVLGFLSSDRR